MENPSSFAPDHLGAVSLPINPPSKLSKNVPYWLGGQASGEATCEGKLRSKPAARRMRQRAALEAQGPQSPELFLPPHPPCRGCSPEHHKFFWGRKLAEKTLAKLYSGDRPDSRARAKLAAIWLFT